MEGFPVGARVVIEPALSCEVRGISPPCHQCQNLCFANCENITKGDISEGVQTGVLSRYGRRVEPIRPCTPITTPSCARRYRRRNRRTSRTLCLRDTRRLEVRIRTQQANICVIGGGTIGLLTVAALRILGYQNRILIFAKYPHQQQLALELGANEIISPNRGRYTAFCELTGSEPHQPELGATGLNWWRRYYF